MRKLSQWIMMAEGQEERALGGLALVLVVTCVALMFFFASGCTSEQLARDEAVVNAGLARIEAGINWAQANPAVVSAALDEAAKLDPGNVHVQQAVAKGKAALASGDVATVQSLVHAAVILTTPSGPASPAPAPATSK